MVDILKGDSAPTFSLPASTGSNISNEDFPESGIVLYFYPKDDTPGCTKEACGFRDSFDELAEKGFVVLGISRDNIESHEKFMNKYTLPFPLLSDPDAVVAKSYGAYGTKNMYGRITEGVLRQTFLIDKNGIVIKVWKRVKTGTHAEDVLNVINDLN
jgi:peroxiredoxin Q/BCP